MVTVFSTILVNHVPLTIMYVPNILVLDKYHRLSIGIMFPL